MKISFLLFLCSLCSDSTTAAFVSHRFLETMKTTAFKSRISLMMSLSEKTKSNSYFEYGDEQRDNRVFQYGPESSTKPLFSHNTPVEESFASTENSPPSISSDSTESQSDEIFDPKYNQPAREIQDNFRNGSDFIQENEDDGEVVRLDLSKRKFDHGPDPPFGHNEPLRVPSTPDDDIRSSRVFHYGPVEPKKPLFDHNTPTPDKNSVGFADRAPPIGQVVPTDRSSRKFTYGPEEKEPLFDHNKPYNAYTANVDEVIYIDGEKHRREFHYGPADVPAKPLFDHNTPVVNNNPGTSFHDRGILGGGLKVTDEERNARKFHYGPEVPKGKPLFDHNTPVTNDRRSNARAFIDLGEERENRPFDSPVPVGQVEIGKDADTKAWFDDESLLGTNDDGKDLEANAGSLLAHDIPATKGAGLNKRDGDGDDVVEDTMTLQDANEIATDEKTREEEKTPEAIEASLDQETAAAQSSYLSMEEGEGTVAEDPIEPVNMSQEMDTEILANDDLDLIGDNKLEEDMPDSAAEQSLENKITEIESLKESDYYKAIQSLQSVLEETNPKFSEVRLWALELWDDLKTKQQAGTDITKSMAVAKAAIATHGPESSEAKEAWAYLESCASGRGGLEGTVLNTALLEEAADAIATLENLSGLVNQEKQRLDEDTQ